MRLFILIFFIVLPSVEIVLLFSWIAESPLLALLYLTLTIAAGLFCIRLAKVGWLEVLPRMRDLGVSGVKVFLLASKLWVAGALLIFPGYITDIAALAVLLLFRGGGPPRRDDGILEVRGRMLDDERELRRPE